MHMEKKQIRKAMIDRRLALSPEERTRLSAGAQQALLRSPLFAEAQSVLLYHPFRGEAETGQIAAAAVQAGKRLALPRVEKEPPRLWLHSYPGDPGALVPGAYGLLEPDPAWPLVQPEAIDLVVLPGVAFDASGRRLGYGGGYYDRTLPALRLANPSVRLIGLAYGFQLVERLPADPHDIPVDGVATEDGLFLTVGP